MPERVADPMIWESARVEALGGAMIAAASAADIGVALVSMEPPAPRVVYISDKGCEIVGHAREAILSRPASDFLSPRPREGRDTTGAPVRADSRPRFFETEVVRADGRPVPLEVSLASISLDGLPGMIAFTRDISARREAVDALARSERRFRQLIEHAPDAVFINDGRRLVFANPAAARMLGYPDVEGLLAIDPRTLFSPEEGASMAARSQEMVRTGKGLPPRDYPTRRRDGSWVLAEVQSMPIDWDGRPAILGFARDVTERKEMETRLTQSERLAALGTLLAGIAHEMNNPLSYALLGIEQAVAQLDGLAASPEAIERLREMLEGAHHGATRVAAVIGQIRATSRPDTADQGPVELRSVLEAALRVIHNELHHRARLVTELGDVPTILGNAQRLEQVFLNLLVNAVQALPDGRAGNEIRVVLRATPAGEVLVEVGDNGPGIPDDVRSRIFDPFFTTKPVGLGLGLGLSICHGIVTSHNGTISVESQPGHGTKFRVALPVPRATPATTPLPSRPKADAAGTGASRRRVLVIDDEPALAAMIRRILAHECQVDIAVDAREGLERLDGPDTYDVILCDLMMPDMTGMDLFAEVARRHPGLERRFIFMTGGAFTPRASDFLAQVKNRRLEKPFDTAVLKAVVARDD